MVPADDSPTSESASPACPCDGSALELVGMTPRVGPYPELKTFRCRNCGEIFTLEAD